MIIFTFFILILLSALFSAAETALYSLRESQVRLMQINKSPNAEIIAKLKKDSKRVLVTILFGSTFVNISIGSLTAILSIDLTNSIGVGVSAGLAAIITLIFGEFLPKSFTISHNKSVAQICAYPIYFIYIILYPFASIFVAIDKTIRRLSVTSAYDTVTEEEIRVMSDLGLEHGGIDQHERTLIENIFKFDDIPVGKIMTKKDQIDALNGNVPVTQIAYYVSQSGFSRFPVYEGSQTNFTGYVHTNDVMRVLNSDERDEFLIGYASPLTRVSEQTNIREVFRKMTKERSHMYLVNKEGRPDEILGLVTMEDILEEIMGEIEDEGDHKENLVM